MCIVAREVQLSNTTIFTCVSGIENDKPTRQLVMYQNKVTYTNKDVNENLMCLPIPLKDGLVPKEHIQLYDFSYEGKGNLQNAYKKFLENVNYPFQRKARGFGASKSLSLEVLQIGGYKCSLARTPADVLNLDPSVFGKPEGLQAVLEQNYEHDFAFLICAFSRKQGDDELDLHPIVYSHPISSEGTFFIPTRHYHGVGKPEPIVNEWDHDIFIFGGDHAKLSEQNAKSSHNGSQFMIAAHDDLPKSCVDVMHDLLKNSKDSFPLSAISANSNAAKLHVEGTFENVDFRPQVLLVAA